VRGAAPTLGADSERGVQDGGKERILRRKGDQPPAKAVTRRRLLLFVNDRREEGYGPERYRRESEGGGARRAGHDLSGYSNDEKWRIIRNTSKA